VSDDGALLASIADAPDDAAPYLVYADALIERGDPRGDFIAVQHALETAAPSQAAELRRREGEALLENDKQWVGISKSLRQLLVVRWKCGFINAARMLFDADDERRKAQGTAIAAFRALLDVPHIGSTLAELHIGPPQELETIWPSCHVFLDALVARWPPALRRLHLNDGDLRGMHAAPVVPLRELDHRPLDTLVVCGRNIDRLPTLPALRRLELRVPGFDLARLADVGTFRALEELVIWTHKLGTLATLTPARFPKLRHLGLVGVSDLVATSLRKLPLLAQLQSLDLSGGTMTGVGPLATVGAKLDVRRNLIPKDAIARLEQRGILARPQRTGTAALTEPHELSVLLQRMTKRGDDHTLGAAERLRKVLIAAERGDPRWAYASRIAIGNELEKAARRDALSAIAADCERELSQHGNAATYLALAGACEELGELDETESWLWLASRAARWWNDGERFRQAQGHIATVRMRKGDSALAAPILQRLADRARKENKRTDEAWAVRQLGNTERMRNEFGAAEIHYRRALELYKQLGDRHQQGIVLSELSSVYWSRGDYTGAETVLRQAIALREGDTVGLGSTYYNLGAILNGANRISEAIEAAQLSREIFHKHRHRSGEAQALSLLGELHQRSNDHATAQQLLEEAIAAHRATGNRPHVGIALGNLARVALDRGEYARARDYCEEAIDIHRTVGNRYNEGMQLLGLGDAAIGERRFADAIATFEEALAPLRAIDNTPAISAVHLHAGIAHHLAGERAAAATRYATCIADARRGKYEEMIGWAELWIAAGRAQDGDHAAAEATLASARGYLATESIQGAEAIAMTAAVLARLAGGTTSLPVPQSWDARLLATLVA